MDYPAGVLTVGPGQWPYDSGSMTPYPPDALERLATRINALAGAGIGYCAAQSDRDALVSNGDAFVGLHVYTAALNQLQRWDGNEWVPSGGTKVRMNGVTDDVSTGATLGNGGTYNSSTQSVTVPAGVTNATARLRTSAYMYLSASTNFAGYFHTVVDGTVDFGVGYGVRYHNHARGGALVFTANWDFLLPAGTHAIGVQLKEDSGSTSHEIWDLQTTLSVDW